MATSIQELPIQETYDADASVLLIENNSTLYQITASVLLNTVSLQTEYMDVAYQNITFYDSDLLFTRDYLFSTQSSFQLTLDFNEKAKLPSVTIIKNAGDTICKILTFEGVFDAAIGETTDLMNLSVYTTQDGRETNIVGAINLESAVSDSITIEQLKLSNVSEFSSINTARCCAKIKARTINS